MRKLILAILICLSTTAFAQKTSFSGSWALDTVRTVFGEAPHYILPRLIQVDQQPGKLVLSRTLQDEDMQDRPVLSETLAFDGTALQQMEREYPTTVTLHWLNDNSFLLSRDGANKATETWALEDGGKTLVMDRSVEQKDNGLKYTIKCYYTKKQ